MYPLPDDHPQPSRPLGVPSGDELPVLLDVMRARLDALGAFVAAFAAAGPADTSPRERALLATADDLLSRALDQFS